MRASLCGLVALHLPTGVVAQAPTAVNEKRLEALSLARARTLLLERAAELPLLGDEALGDWIAARKPVERALRLWSRNIPRHGRARRYDDGVVESDIRLEPMVLVDHLLATVVTPEVDLSPEDRQHAESRLRAAAQRWPVLWVTGRAAPEPDAAGAIAGWEDVSRTGVEAARAAASDDALAALWAATQRLPIDDKRTVGGFINTAPAIRDPVRQQARHEARLRVEYAPERFALAHAELPLRELLRILTRVHQEHYTGTEYAAADFRQMILRQSAETLSAVGVGMPPEDTLIQPRLVPRVLDVPTWSNTTLVASGHYRPAGDDNPAPDARAQAARLDALAALYGRVAELEVQPGTTVAAYLGYHQDLKSDVALLITAARTVEGPRATEGGRTEVTVALPLERLWQIVRRKMIAQEAEPPEDIHPPAVSQAEERGVSP